MITSWDERKLAKVATVFSILFHLVLALVFLIAWVITPKSEIIPKKEDKALLISSELFDPSFIRSNPSQEIENAPENPTQESDINTQAATELVKKINSNEQMPSQEGELRDWNELQNLQLNQGEQPKDIPIQPTSTPPSELSPPESAEQPTKETEPTKPPEPPKTLNPTPEDLLEQIDTLTKIEIHPKDEPSETKPPEPEQQKPTKAVPPMPLPATQPKQLAKPTPPTPATPPVDVFTPQTKKNRIYGTLSNKGPSSVNAKKTPRGIYMRKVTSAIEKRWHIYRSQNLDFATFGNIRLKFSIGNSGNITGTRIISQDANAVMIDFTLRAIRDANIPPIPADVRQNLDNQPLDFTYDVLIY